jgi:hypothetical protein
MDIAVVRSSHDELALTSTLGPTPTAGGVVFFGDLNAIDAATGEKHWSQDLGESAAA